MVAAKEHSVGLRELRHQTGKVLARVRQGEALDVTEYGRVIARLVPAPEAEASPILEQLVAAGRVRRAERPGYRPPMLPGDGSDSLTAALASLRAEERW